MRNRHKHHERRERHEIHEDPVPEDSLAPRGHDSLQMEEGHKSLCPGTLLRSFRKRGVVVGSLLPERKRKVARDTSAVGATRSGLVRRVPEAMVEACVCFVVEVGRPCAKWGKVSFWPIEWSTSIRRSDGRACSELGQLSLHKGWCGEQAHMS